MLRLNITAHNATKWASAIEDTHTRIQQLITRCDNASVMMLTLATVLRRLDEASYKLEALGVGAPSGK